MKEALVNEMRAREEVKKKAIEDEDLEMYDPEDHETEEGEAVDISSEEELELEDETV